VVGRVSERVAGYYVFGVKVAVSLVSVSGNIKEIYQRVILKGYIEKIYQRDISKR
jgi:hypothetical protein